VSLIQCEQGHHDARRAKAALGSVVFNQLRLHDMQGLRRAGKLSSRHDDLAVRGMGRLDATVHSTPLQAIRTQLAQCDCAGTAITAGAPFFDRQIVQIIPSKR
jgi:hypothetical protein